MELQSSHLLRSPPHDDFLPDRRECQVSERGQSTDGLLGRSRNETHLESIDIVHTPTSTECTSQETTLTEQLQMGTTRGGDEAEGTVRIEQDGTTAG